MKKRNGFVSNSSSTSFVIGMVELPWQRVLEREQVHNLLSRGRYDRTILKYLRKSNSHEQRKKWRENHTNN